MAGRRLIVTIGHSTQERANALLVRGWRVRHIARDGRLSDHELTPFAVADGTRLTYPPEQLRLG